MKVLFFPGAFGNDERAEWWSYWPRAFLPDAEWVNVGYGADGPPCASVDEAAWRASRRLDALGLWDQPVVAVCYSSGAQVLRRVLARGHTLDVRRAVFWSAVPSGGVPLLGMLRSAAAAPYSFAASLLSGRCSLRSDADVRRLMFSGAPNRAQDAWQMRLAMHDEVMYGLVGDVFLYGMRKPQRPLPPSVEVFAIVPDGDVIVGGCRYEDENVQLLATLEDGHHGLIRDAPGEGSDLEELHQRAAAFLTEAATPRVRLRVL